MKSAMQNGWRLLLIGGHDDDKDIVEELKGRGMEVVYAANADMALQYSGSNDFDLAIIHVQHHGSAGNSGVEKLTYRLRIPLVIVTKEHKLLEELGLSKLTDTPLEMVATDELHDGLPDQQVFHGYHEKVKSADSPAEQKKEPNDTSANMKPDPGWNQSATPGMDSNTVTMMAGGIAHDVNNLLTIVSTCSALLLDEDITCESHRLLADILQASHRASALMQQLMEVCHDQLSYSHTVNVNNLIEENRSLMQRLLGNESSLIVDTGEERILAAIDPRELEQVLLNLVMNARDALTDGGTVRIATQINTVDTSSSTAGLAIASGEYLELTVSDTGCGIPDHLKSRIFEPFVSTKQQSQHGIGLANVRRMIENAGGNIRVHSELGRGSTFHLYLPLVRRKSEI